MYYLYHIPGKKIGVTQNPEKRITKEQGYKEGEYEVLLKTDDINIVSDLELRLQESFGYRRDMQPYNKVIKRKMKINVTEQTTTFPCPLNKLKGNLMDNLGLKWKTQFGLFKLSERTISWIVANSKVSMYNPERCYIYNKAYFEAFAPDKYDINGAKSVVDMPKPAIFDAIRMWAEERGIYDKGDAKTQYVKLAEEFGELAKALLKDDQPEIIDAIGDMVVVLTNLAHQRGVNIEACIQSAYDVISKRKGKMVNGTFVKDED
jgi:NTP pyrophosphatase (non-canonical NTP hydrolase)